MTVELLMAINDDDVYGTFQYILILKMTDTTNGTIYVFLQVNEYVHVPVHNFLRQNWKLYSVQLCSLGKESNDGRQWSNANRPLDDRRTDYIVNKLWGGGGGVPVW